MIVGHDKFAEVIDVLGNYQTKRNEQTLGSNTDFDMKVRLYPTPKTEAGYNINTMQSKSTTKYLQKSPQAHVR